MKLFLAALMLAASSTYGAPLYANLIVNGGQIEGIFFAEVGKDIVVISESGWVAANLKIKGTPIKMTDGNNGYVIERSSLMSYRVSLKEQTLHITAESSLFNMVDIGSTVVKKTYANLASPGAYINYAVASTSGYGRREFGAEAELIASSSFGSIVSGFNGNAKRLVRTNTYFQKDTPDTMQRLIVGDAVSVAGSWSRAVRIGGVVWSSDYSLGTGFTSGAPITINGSAALPSTVDVMINNQRQQTSSVGSGPFQLKNMPMINGEGLVSIIVRDALGNEKISTQKFYSSPIVLADGLSTFSYETGFLRTGGPGKKYSNPMISATQRIGISGFTLERQVEVQAKRQAAGISIVGVVGQLAVMSASIAASSTDYGYGRRAVLGVERTTQKINLSAQLEHNDDKFKPLGYIPQEILSRNTLALGIGFEYYKSRWINLNIINKSYYSAPSFSMASLNMFIPISKMVSLGIYANRRLDSSHDFNLGLNLIFRENSGSTIVAKSNIGAGGLTNALQYSESNDTGTGYSVTASDTPNQNIMVSASKQTPFNSMTADIARGNYGSSLRLSSNGSLGIMNTHVFASPRINHASFAMVKVADQPGVGIYLSNRKVATTDNSGYAVVSPLMPYIENNVSIRAEELPLNFEIKESSRSISPFARSGVFVDFDIKKSNNRLVQLSKKDGSFIPVGSIANISTSNDEFTVAKRGMIYLKNIQSEVDLLVKLTNGEICKTVLLEANDIVMACDNDKK